MGSLKELKKRLRKADLAELKRKVVDIVVNDEELIYLKLDEFKQGKKPDGSPIGEYMSENYRIFKEKKNPRANGYVDLIFTGSFASGIYTYSLGKHRFVFKSTDNKSKMLRGKYGEEIMGINQQDWNRLQKEKYAPMLMRYIKQLTGL